MHAVPLRSFRTVQLLLIQYISLSLEINIMNYYIPMLKKYSILLIQRNRWIFKFLRNAWHLSSKLCLIKNICALSITYFIPVLFKLFWATAHFFHWKNLEAHHQQKVLKNETLLTVYFYFFELWLIVFTILRWHIRLSKCVTDRKKKIVQKWSILQ